MRRTVLNLFKDLPSSSKAALSLSLSITMLALTIQILFVSAAAIADGNGSYTANDVNAGNVSVITLTFNENLSSENSIPCIDGFPPNTLCFDVSNISLGGGGYDENASLALAYSFENNRNSLFVAFDQNNAILNLGANPSISVSNFGGISGVQVFNVFASEGGEGGGGGGGAPQANYTADVGGGSELTMNMSSDLDNTNAVECGDVPPGVTICYNPVGAISLSNFAEGISASNIVALFKSGSNPRELRVRFDQANVISGFDPSPAIEVNNIGGINFMEHFVINPPGGGGGGGGGAPQANYASNVSGVSQIAAIFDQSIDNTGSETCALGAPDGVLCYTVTGKVSLSNFAEGINTSNINYMYRDAGNNREMRVIFDQVDVISSFSATPTIQFNNLGGIAGPITFNVVGSLGGGGEGGGGGGGGSPDPGPINSADGNAEYSASTNSRSRLTLQFTENLTSSPGNTTCPEGAPIGVVCYSTGNIQLGGGSGTYIDGASIAYAYRENINTRRLIVVFDQENVISNFGNTPTISVNNFAGISSNISFNIINPSGGGEEPGGGEEGGGAPSGGVINGFFFFNKAFVVGEFPWNGSVIPYNNRVFGVQFSNQMSSDSFTTNNMTLSVVGGSSISGTVSYDTITRTGYFVANSDLTPGNSIRLSLNTSIVDIAGNQVPHQIDYVVGSSQDLDAPEVSWSNPISGQENVSTLLPNIAFGFDKALDPNTITIADIAATPSINGSIFYDPLAQAIFLKTHNEALSTESDYQVTLIGSGINDIYGNFISENYTLEFSTGAELVSPPSVNWVDIYKDGFRVSFDLPMKQSDVTTKNKYSLSCGSTVNLDSADFTYHNDLNELEVTGIQTSNDEGTSCTLTLSNSIRAANNIGLPDDELIYNATVKTNPFGKNFFEDLSENSGFEWLAGSFDNSFDKQHENPAFQAFNPYNLKLEKPITGATTSMIFEFPILKTLTSANVIDIVMPNGFKFDNASISSESINNDINGQAPGKVSLSAIAINKNTQTISLTLSISGVESIGSSGDQLKFKLDNIINSSTASSVGYVAKFKTRTSSSQIIEGPNEFPPFPLNSPGNGQVSIVVKNKTTNSAISGVKVSFESPALGYQESTTNGSGTASVTQIAVNSAGTNLEAYVGSENIPEGYIARRESANAFLTEANSNLTRTIFLEPASLRVTGTISHSGVGTDGKTNVNLWLSGPDWMQKKITLDNDGSTNFSIYVAQAGKYQFGIDKFFDPRNGGVTGEEFISPAPKSINLTDSNSPLTANFAISAPSKTITGTVKDSNDNPIPSAYVTISSDHSDSTTRFSVSKKTIKDGTYSIGVEPGKYQMEVSLPGVSGGVQRRVEVLSSDTSITQNFILKKPNISISGTVSNGTNKIEYASVDCFNEAEGQSAFATTDSNGKFNIFVNSGTWTCRAFSPQLGEIPAAGDVDANKFLVTASVTGMNFSYNNANIAEITGTILDSSGSAVSNIWVSADLVDSTGKPIGFVNGANTNADGSFVIRAKKNTSSQRIEVKMWDNRYGEAKLATNINLNNGNKAIGIINLASQKKLTINALNIPSGVQNLFVNIQNNDTGTWSWKDISLSDGAGSNTINLIDGNYTLNSFVPGIGDIKQNFQINGQDKSVSINLANKTTTTVTVVVKDSSGNLISNAFVDAYNKTNNIYISGTTNSSGVASLQLQSGRYTLKASKSGYASATTTTVTDTNSYLLTLASTDSSISGTVKNSSGSTVAYAWVDAITTDGSKWVGIEADGNGNFTLGVRSGTTWNVRSNGPTGNYGTQSNVAAGASGLIVSLTQTVSHFVAKEPISNTIDPTKQTNISTELGDFQAPAGINEDSNGFTLAFNKISSVPDTDTMKALGGIGLEINATSNTDGSSITQFNGNTSISMKIDKEQITSLVANDDNFQLRDLNTSLGYFDASNNAWQILDGATTYAQIQQSSGSEYANLSIENFIEGYQSTYKNYNDYKVVYKANSDHLTIFAPVDEESEDTTAPDAPSHLSASSLISNQVVLDWDDNLEEDLLEYEVYRSSSSDVSAINANQINSDSVNSSSFTDTDVLDGQTYYYTVTAVDLAGNESTLATEVSITVGSDDDSEVEEEEDEELGSESESSSGGGSTANYSVLDDLADQYAQDDNLENSQEAKDDTEAEKNDEESEEPKVKTTYKIDTKADYADHWAAEYIAELYGRAIVGGCDKQSNYCPNASITRAELTKIVLATYGIEENTSLSANPFTDLSKDHWAYHIILTAYDEGIVSGNKDKTFAPDAEITRAAAMKIVLEGAKISLKTNTTNVFKDVEDAVWYTNYVLTAYAEGIVSGYQEDDGLYFKPDKPITRGEFAKIVLEAEELIQ